MAAVRPRITFTPGPDTLLALRRISKVSREPISSVVTESMALLNEHLLNLASVLEQADALTGEARAIMHAAADRAADDLRPHAMEAERVIASLARTVEDITSGVEPTLPLGGGGPPSSNTGVTGQKPVKEMAR